MKPAHDARSTGVFKDKRILLGVALLAGVLAALLAALPAYAQLTGVAPRVDRTGFPAWYQDDTGARVNLCVDNRLCLGGDTRPNRNRPASPTVDANPRRPGIQPNMPDEAFYAIARAETELNDGGRIRWRGVLEGAFATAIPRAGAQITFTRVQVRDPVRGDDRHGQRRRDVGEGPRGVAAGDEDQQLHAPGHGDRHRLRADVLEVGSRCAPRGPRRLPGQPAHPARGRRRRPRRQHLPSVSRNHAREPPGGPVRDRRPVRPGDVLIRAQTSKEKDDE